MNYAPTWYQTLRSAILLLETIIGLFALSFPLRRKPWFLLRLGLSTAAGMLFLGLVASKIYVVGYTPEALVSHAVMSILVYASLLVMTLMCFDETIWTLLFVTASAYIAQDLAGSIKTLMRELDFFRELARTTGVIAVDVICYGTVFILLHVMLRPYTKQREAIFDSKIKAVFSIVVLVICIGMARLTQDNPNRDHTALIAETIYQVLIDILIIALQLGVMEATKLSKHVETMRELVHQQRVQYEASKESAQIINEKYHDLKHLIKSFHGTVPQEQLDKLKQSIAAYERPVDSGNEVLDVLLNEKIGLCQQRNIVLTCNLGHTDLSFVEELDLYSLFQNALGNAVTAVSELPLEAERFISLSAQRDGNMVTIHMENPCTGDVHFVNGLPMTKEDPDLHGFGMKSMVRMVEKYGGTLTTELRGKLFMLDILLLAPSKENG